MKNQDLKSLLVTAGFIVSGLRDSCAGLVHPDGRDSFSVLLDKWAMGCYELVYAATEFALQIESARKLCFEHDDFEPSGGIFEYEVSEEFGSWFGKHILANHEGKPPIFVKCAAKISELVDCWAYGPTKPEAVSTAMTEQDIVAACERVARQLMKDDGFDLPKEVSMRTHPSTRAKIYWRNAVAAIEAYNGTDVENAIANLGLAD